MNFQTFTNCLMVTEGRAWALMWVVKPTVAYGRSTPGGQQVSQDLCPALLCPSADPSTNVGQQDGSVWRWQTPQSA